MITDVNTNEMITYDNDNNCNNSNNEISIKNSNKRDAKIDGEVPLIP